MRYWQRVFAVICLLLLSACCYIPPIYPAINLNQHCRIKPPRAALVLGGGGARGFAHLGVIKALEEAKIPIELIVGSSAGSLVGSLYAANPHIDDITRVMMSSSYLDYIDISISQALSGPIIGTQLQQFVSKHTSNCSIRDLKIPFIAVATDLNTGRTVAMTQGVLGIAVHASCAIPSVVKPVQFLNATLIDGGVTDPVPVDIAKQYHPKVTIAVNINSEPRAHLPLTMPNIIGQSLNIMMQALTRYNVTQADIVIRPKVGTVNMFDLSKKEKLYREGLMAGRKAVPEIKRLLRDAS